MMEDRFARAIQWCSVLAFTTLVGCGRAVSSGVPHAPAPAAVALASSDSCWLAPPPVEPADSLLIVVDHRTGALDDGRRLIETLTALLPVRADCTGRAAPALSVRWQDDSAAQPHRLVPTEQTSGLPVLRIASLEPGVDARDAIDRGADLLITQDPDVVRYAAVRGDRLIVPLPARWTYGMLTIADESRVHATQRLTDGELQAFRESLTRDVVPAAAVAARDDTSSAPVGCSMAISSPRDGSAGGARRLVHRADDPVARALAERLVSLATRPGDAAGRLLAAGERPIVATGMDSAAFAAALSAGGSSAFLIAWPSSHGDACASLGSGRGEAQRSSKDGAAPAAQVTALIDAAAWAIVRQGAAGLMRDAAGEARLVVTPIDPAASSP